MKNTILAATLGFIFLLSANVTAQDFGTVLLIDSDQLEPYWLVEKKVAPTYPSRAAIANKQGCVAVLYMIEADGSTSKHRVVVAYPKRHFDRASLRAAKQFLYKPSKENESREPVFTVNSFTFELLNDNRASNDDKGKKLADKCTDAAYELLAQESGKVAES